MNKSKEIILTFDDGPSRQLPQILDILKEESVPALFFWNSRLLHHQRPWKRALAEGHQIGSHSSRHRNLADLSFEQQYNDIKNSLNQLEKVIPEKILYFRPPFGQFNEDTLAVAEKLELQTVMWRISSMDWELKGTPQQIVKNVIDNVEEGTVILLHELTQTVEVLPTLIKMIKDKGYKFGSLGGNKE